MANDRVVHCVLKSGGFVRARVSGVGGSTVLLLHGIPGGRQQWDAVSAELADSMTCVAPDLLGFGESSDPIGDFHAEAQAAAVEELLDLLGVRVVHVVGWDFGGPVAVALSRRAPLKIASLTLVSTNVFTDTPVPGVLNLAHVPGLGEALFTAMCSFPGLAGMWFGAVTDKQRLPFGRFVAELPGRRGRRWTRRIFLDSLRHLRARYGEIEAALPQLRCRVEVVWGDSDPFFAVSVGERTARALRHAQFSLLDGCGHFVPGERPRAIVEAVRRQILALAT
ncbi:MAG TPA: alpha/beta hydrolase [Vicinamibacterales bacterium]|nr:alpha/beta hydrolase [Vicinamibacterales bacterium]